MKKYLTTLLILFIYSGLFAQLQIDWLNVYEEYTPDGKIELYATNSGHCPITIILDFDKLKNLKVRQSLPIQKVIEHNEEAHLIATLTPQGNKGTEYNFNLNYRLGNIINVQPDDYTYLLPFEKGTACTVGQGYNGRFSHGDLNAIDFDMDIGTNVCAARDGVVIAIKEDSNQGCTHSKCQRMANYVLVYHDDGTFASYVHLKKNGVLLETGERVKAGQVIAKSGNTGWSSGPHLHFEVYKPGEKENIAIKTKFLIAEGNTDILKERQTYKAFHP